MSRLALLIALGVDNVGSGFFLPLTLVYVTRVVGLPLSTAGTAVTLGTVAGLLVPPIAGRLVDRVGPRLAVIAAQLAQALGAGAFLVAGGTASVVVATLLLAAGQQLFYSSLFALISDVAGDGAKDRPFAVVAMVRSGCFGLGTLVGGALLTAAGSAGLRVAVAANAVSFVAGAALLATSVRPPRRTQPPAYTGRLRADRRFLALIAITALIVLSIDFFVAGMGVYVLDVLGGRPWLPGVVVALLTAIDATCGTFALWATRRLARTTAMALGAVFAVAWCGACLAAGAVPAGWLPAVLLPATLLLAASGLLCGVRAIALATELAPAAARGRYLAAFQYSFTVPGVLAPAVVALFTVALWLPWLLVACCGGVAAAGFLRFGQSSQDSSSSNASRKWGPIGSRRSG